METKYRQESRNEKSNSDEMDNTTKIVVGVMIIVFIAIAIIYSIW